MGIKVNNPLFRRGFVQALGVTIYCSLIGLLMSNGNKLFGNSPNFFGPVAFLLLFSFSALVCALIVFYKPYTLFFEGNKKEAVNLVVYTSAWLLLFLLLFLLFAIIL